MGRFVAGRSAFGGAGGRIAAALAPLRTASAFGGGVRLPHARSLTAGLLSFGGLPATHELAALGILTVTLIPLPRRVPLATAFAQADSSPRSAARRNGRRARKLMMSQGRSCSRGAARAAG